MKNYFNHKTKIEIAAEILLALVSLALILSSFGMIFANSRELTELAPLHIEQYINILGLFKLLGALGLWFPKYRKLAILVISGYLGGAMMANIVMYEFPLPPAVMLIIIWSGMHIKHKDVLK